MVQIEYPDGCVKKISVEEAIELGIDVNSPDAPLICNDLNVEVVVNDWVLCSDAFVIDVKDGYIPDYLVEYFSKIQFDLTDNQSFIDLNKMLMDRIDPFANEISHLKNDLGETTTEMKYIKVGNAVTGAIVSKIDGTFITSKEARAISAEAVGSVFGGSAEAWYTNISATMASEVKATATNVQEVSASLGGVKASLQEIKDVLIEAVDNPLFNVKECRRWWFNDSTDARSHYQTGQKVSNDPLNPDFDPGFIAGYDSSVGPVRPEFIKGESEYPSCDRDSTGQPAYSYNTKVKYQLILDAGGDYVTGIDAINEVNGGNSTDHFYVSTNDFGIVNPYKWDEARFPSDPADANYDPSKFLIRASKGGKDLEDPTNTDYSLSVYGSIFSHQKHPTIANEGTMAVLSSGDLNFYRHVNDSGRLEGDNYRVSKSVTSVVVSSSAIYSGERWIIPTYFKNRPIVIALPEELTTYQALGGPGAASRQKSIVQVSQPEELREGSGQWVCRVESRLATDNSFRRFSEDVSGGNFDDEDGDKETTTNIFTAKYPISDVNISVQISSKSKQNSCWSWSRCDLSSHLEYNAGGGWVPVAGLKVKHSTKSGAFLCSGTSSPNERLTTDLSISWASPGDDQFPTGTVFRIRLTAVNTDNEPTKEMAADMATISYTIHKANVIDRDSKYKLMAIEDPVVADDINTTKFTKYNFKLDEYFEFKQTGWLYKLFTDYPTSKVDYVVAAFGSSASSDIFVDFEGKFAKDSQIRIHFKVVMSWLKVTNGKLEYIVHEGAYTHGYVINLKAGADIAFGGPAILPAQTNTSIEMSLVEEYGYAPDVFDIVGLLQVSLTNNDQTESTDKIQIRVTGENFGVYRSYKI